MAGLATTAMTDENGIEPVTNEALEDKAEAERLRRQRQRSIAIAIGLVLLVVLFYAATLVHLGGNVYNRAM